MAVPHVGINFGGCPLAHNNFLANAGPGGGTRWLLYYTLLMQCLMFLILGQGKWVWFKDTQEVCLPAQCLSDFETGKPADFKLEDGRVVQASAEDTKDMTVLDPQILDVRIDNLIRLNQLTEPAILHNLRIRFKADIVYTNVGTAACKNHSNKTNINYLTLIHVSILSDFEYSHIGESI